MEEIIKDRVEYEPPELQEVFLCHAVVGEGESPNVEQRLFLEEDDEEYNITPKSW